MSSNKGETSVVNTRPLLLTGVQLTKESTCLTYALTRLGLPPGLCNYVNYGDYFYEKPFFFGPYMNRGVILLWDSNKKTSDLAWQIDGTGKIKHQPVIHNVHFAVYEGDGLVSDCSRNKDKNCLPEIKLRAINDIRRQPDKILIYKNVIKNEKRRQK